jgi:hypothetical protein
VFSATTPRQLAAVIEMIAAPVDDVLAAQPQRDVAVRYL